MAPTKHIALLCLALPCLGLAACKRTRPEPALVAEKKPAPTEARPAGGPRAGRAPAAVPASVAVVSDIQAVSDPLEEARRSAFARRRAGKDDLARKDLAAALEGAYPLYGPDARVESWLGLVGDLMELERDAGALSQCLGHGREAATGRDDASSTRLVGSEARERVELLTTLCEAGRSKAIGPDASKPCGESGRSLSGACYEARSERAGVVVTRRGVKRELAFLDGALAAKGACGGTVRAAWTAERTARLRVVGDLSTCKAKRPTAQVDAVYRVTPQGLRMVDEVLARYH
jgi:hypothetical protein